MGEWRGYGALRRDPQAQESLWRDHGLDLRCRPSADAARARPEAHGPVRAIATLSTEVSHKAPRLSGPFSYCRKNSLDEWEIVSYCCAHAQESTGNDQRTENCQQRFGNVGAG